MVRHEILTHLHVVDSLSDATAPARLVDLVGPDLAVAGPGALVAVCGLQHHPQLVPHLLVEFNARVNARTSQSRHELIQFNARLN